MPFHSARSINRRTFLKSLAVFGMAPAASWDFGASVVSYQERPSQRLVTAIGVGGGGLIIVDGLARGNRFPRCRFVAVDADEQLLKSSLCPQKVWVDLKITGFYEGGDSAISREAALRTTDAILAASGAPDLAVVVATLGGGMGSGAGEAIASLVKNAGISTIAVVSTPFFFEGLRRQAKASEALEAFRETADFTLCVPYERLLAELPRGTTLRQAYQEADRVMARAVAGILDLTSAPRPC